MSWQESPLGEIADTQLGKMLDAKKNEGEYHPYLGNDNVQWGGIGLSEVKEMRFKESELAKFALRSGDLLVCEGGDPGRCAIWNSDEEMYYQKALHRVRAHEGVLDNWYLYYFLVHIGSTQEIRQYYTGGATIKHLPAAALNRVKVRYPDLSTQKRIVGVLSVYDELIENNRRQIKLLEEAAQRLYKEWFIDLKFPGHETTPIVDGLLEGWKRGTLLTLVDVVRGCSYSSDEIIQGEKTLINLGNLTPFGGFRFGYEKPFSGKSREDQLVAKGDVVMGLTEQAIGLAGYAALLPTVPDGSVVSADLVKIAPKQGVPAEFVYALLRYGRLSELISPLANGTKIKHLRPQSLSRVTTQIPSIELMQRYAAVVCPAYEQIDVCQQQVAAAREARDRLLPKLMSGEIEV